VNKAPDLWKKCHLYIYIAMSIRVTERKEYWELLPTLKYQYTVTNVANLLIMCEVCFKCSLSKKSYTGQHNISLWFFYAICRFTFIFIVYIFCIFWSNYLTCNCSNLKRYRYTHKAWEKAQCHTFLFKPGLIHENQLKSILLFKFGVYLH
jgi:hypothetical protein